MKAIILSVGDELVLGQTVDTNSAWLSRQLAAVGCAVVGHLTVPDDQPAIEQAMLESVGRCDVLLISGGIGPTADDLTRQALAAVLGVPLEMNSAWLAELERFFTARGRRMAESNRVHGDDPARRGVDLQSRRHRGGHRRALPFGRPEDRLPDLRHARRAEGNDGDVHPRRAPPRRRRLGRGPSYCRARCTPTASARARSASAWAT
jgi:molybdenum cofactor synthesis domain-containing protein